MGIGLAPATRLMIGPHAVPDGHFAVARGEAHVKCQESDTLRFTMKKKACVILGAPCHMKIGSLHADVLSNPFSVIARRARGLSLSARSPGPTVPGAATHFKLDWEIPPEGRCHGAFP